MQHAAHDRQLEHLPLAEPVDPPRDPSDHPPAEQDAVEVRHVVGGQDHRALSRDGVEVALDPHTREHLGADAGGEPEPAHGQPG